MGFLQEHHPSLAPPIPIEEIVEFRFELDIVPFPDLKRNFDIDGFLAYGLNAVYVDQFQLMNRPGRYRFTLAHELCHMLLHREIYDEAKIRSLDDYIRFQEELDPDLRAAYEFQAMNLAGRILLPKDTFLEACTRVLAPLQKRIPPGTDVSLLCELIADRTGPPFEVSDEVAFRRLFKDGLYLNLDLGSR